MSEANAIGATCPTYNWEVATARRKENILLGTNYTKIIKLALHLQN